MSLKLCPVCQQNPAEVDSYIGVMPCLDCVERRALNSLPSHPVEFTSGDIKTGRVEYFNSAIQPRRLGEASKEFIETYPETAKETFSEKEIKNAKNVWKDLKGWQTRKNSK